MLNNEQCVMGKKDHHNNHSFLILSSIKMALQKIYELCNSFEQLYFLCNSLVLSPVFLLSPWMHFYKILQRGLFNFFDFYSISILPTMVKNQSFAKFTFLGENELACQVDFLECLQRIVWMVLAFPGLHIRNNIMPCLNYGDKWILLWIALLFSVAEIWRQNYA